MARPRAATTTALPRGMSRPRRAPRPPTRRSRWPSRAVTRTRPRPTSTTARPALKHSERLRAGHDPARDPHGQQRPHSGRPAARPGMGMAVVVVVVMDGVMVVAVVVVVALRSGGAAAPAAHDQPDAQQGDQQAGGELEPGHQHPGHDVVAGRQHGHPDADDRGRVGEGDYRPQGDRLPWGAPLPDQVGGEQGLAVPGGERVQGSERRRAGQQDGQRPWRPERALRAREFGRPSLAFSSPEICQRRCLDPPHPAPCALRPPQPLRCDVVVARGVERRCAWCPRSLHTAEVVGSNPTTPTDPAGSHLPLPDDAPAQGRSAPCRCGSGAARPAGAAPGTPPPG
jgi:hypothetical protein